MGTFSDFPVLFFEAAADIEEDDARDGETFFTGRGATVMAVSKKSI